MAGTSDFIEVATGAGSSSNLEPLATYLTDPTVASGEVPGIANPLRFNREARQAMFGVANITNVMAAILNAHITDDADSAEFQQNFLMTVLAGGTILTDTGTANHIVVAPPVAFPAPASIPDGLALRIVPANTSTSGTCDVAISGGTAVSITDTFGNALQIGDIAKGYVQTLIKTGGGSPKFWLVKPPNTLFLGGAAQFYVDASIGSDSYDGLSATVTGGHGPWLTLQHARNTIQKSINTQGYIVTFNCNGAFTAGLVASGPLIGAFGSVAEVWNFTSGSSVGVTNNIAFNAAYGANLTVTAAGAGLSINASGTSSNQGYGFLATSYASISLGTNLIFGACATADIAVVGGAVIANYSFAVDSGGQNFLYGYQGNISFAPGITVTFNSQTFSTATVNVTALSNLTIGGVTFFGGVTGVRYAASENSILNTSGGGASYIPGTSSGSSSSGAQYI